LIRRLHRGALRVSEASEVYLDAYIDTQGIYIDTNLHLAVTGVDPGRGPRTLIRGGKLHTQYKITLPESFFVGSEG